ncbi:SH3 domain protein [Jannaschia seosinensis]|uniref:SH3 domain protein n=1 Tax=Jannaschia seosinensis TaxID=313367 RepID=A0A0M7BBK2_9RHOB|nr:SH3 domain-containing protein [Jannaschia seosinensis]CUH39194.1 SH3 domain protein [Jannaschia seosinensis]
MIMKMTFALAVAIYAGFVIWGAPKAELADGVIADQEAPIASAHQRPVILTAADDETQVTRAAADTIVPDAATIAAAPPAPNDPDAAASWIGEPTTVSLREPPASGAEATSRATLRVTGSRVNLRSGPSTGNQVVDSLPEGTLTEALAPERDGWIEIRDLATGRTGFMAAQFLSSQ